MRLASRSVALVVGLLAILALASAPAVAADSVTLSGTISAPTGQTGSVAGTEVSVRMPGTAIQVAYAQTDAEGRYEIAGLTPGTYDLRFAPPVGSGFGVTLLTNEPVSADRRVDLQLLSADSAVWSGVLRDGAGAPLRDSIVYLGAASDITDDAGRFELRVPAGTHDFQISARPQRRGRTAAYLSAGGRVTVAGTLAQDIVLPTVDVTLRVVTTAGMALPGAHVSTNYAEARSVSLGGGITAAWVGAGGLSLYGDEEGLVTTVVPRNPTQAFTGRVEAVGLAPLPIEIADLDSDVTQDAVLERGVLWSGVVRDGSGAAIPSAEIGLGPSSTRADEHGRFAVRAMPGPYELTVRGNAVRGGVTVGQLAAWSSIDLDGDIARDITVPTVDVAIDLTDAEGSPIRDASVSAEYLEIRDPDGGLGEGLPARIVGSSGWNQTPDEHGRVTFVVPRGTGIELRGNVRSPGAAAESFVIGDLTSDVRRTIRMGPGVVWSGVVRDGSGAAVGGGLVFVGTASGNIDEHGRFAVRVAPGTHPFWVEGRPVRGGRTLATVMVGGRDVTLTSDRERDIVLPTVDVVIGAVGPSGSAVADARVRVPYVESRDVALDDDLISRYVGVGGAEYRTDADGRLALVLPRGADLRFEGSVQAPDETTLPALWFVVEGLGSNLTKILSFARSAVDPDPPVVVCDTESVGEGAWSSVPPTITCHAEDDGTGLADPAQATFTVRPQVPDEGEYEGTYPAFVRVCDKADNCTERTIPVNVDTKAPSLEASVPSRGGSYPQGSTVAIGYTCRDAGSGVKRCRPRIGNEPGAPLDTSTPGHHVIVVECEDEAGNVREEEIPYEVTASPGPTDPVTRGGYLDVVSADGPIVLWGATGGTDLGAGPTLSYANPAGATTADGLFPDDRAARFAGSPTYAYGNGLSAPAGDYTLAAWVRPTTAGQTATIMGQGSAGWLLLRGGTPVFRAVDREVQGGAAPTDRWTHVVGTWSKDDRVARLYVDGVLVASGPAPTAPSGGATFYLGYGEHAGWYHGAIDEPAVFPAALSAERVAAHFAAGDVPSVPDAAPAPSAGGSGSTYSAASAPPAALELAGPSGPTGIAAELAPEGARIAAPRGSRTAPERSGDDDAKGGDDAAADAGDRGASRRASSGSAGIATVLLRGTSGRQRQAVVRCPRSKSLTTCRGSVQVRARNGRTVKTIGVAVKSGRAKTLRLPSRAASVRFVARRSR